MSQIAEEANYETFWEGNTMFILLHTQNLFIDATINKHVLQSCQFP